MRDLGATAYTGTPSFLKIILEKADELGVSLPKLTKAVVTGEALPGSLRQWFTDRGITVRQCYATADLGLIAYETTPGAGMVLDENIIVELVKPGSGEWVAEGEVGEVVVTSFNRDYPLIRFATGDLSAFHPDASPCGRTNRVIKGWMGRADQTAKIKGMFVHPEQIHAIVKRHPEIQHARLVVDRADDFDVMTLQIETTESSPTLQQAVADTMRDITKLRGEVQLCPPQSLARDGKVIDDIRKFE
jgi:phenylacetate-CoA ligase